MGHSEHFCSVQIRATPEMLLNVLLCFLDGNLERSLALPSNVAGSLQPQSVFVNQLETAVYPQQQAANESDRGLVPFTQGKFL